MIGREIRMVMVHRIGIGAGPEPQGGEGSDGRNRRPCGKRRRLPDTGAQQTHQGIADQPGAMAERELSRKQGRAVVGIGRAWTHSARWRPAPRIGDPEDEPERKSVESGKSVSTRVELQGGTDVK